MKLRFTFLWVLLQLVPTGFMVWGAQQTVSLANNWNLISLWVQPANSDPEVVFAKLINLNRLLSVYTYECNPGGSQGEWKRFYKGLSANESWLNTLSRVRACQGYWVNLTSGPTVSLVVTGEVVSARSRELQTGWNLIGLGNDRRVFWADAFGSLAGGLQAVFGFDPGNRTFIGFNSPEFKAADVNGNAQIELDEFDWTYQQEAGQLRYIEPGQALWVKVPSADMDLVPVIEVEVESDVDPFPPNATSNQWFEPGIDTDINGNGFLDYGFSMPGQYDQYGNEYLNTQDTIWFRVPTGAAHRNLVVLRQDITVVNSGSGGFLHFEVGSDMPWVVATPTNGAVLAGPGGQVVSLQAEMAGLPVGEHSGTVWVRSNGGTNRYLVKLTVPELDGMYTGEITLTNLQGRLTHPLTWPVRIQLALRSVSVLEAAGSPNFPADIVLINHGSSSNFDLSGSLTLNQGDMSNPFHVAVQRAFRLSGGRIASSPGQTVGMNLGLMGGYEEIMTGLPGGPILLQGYLTLNAKTDKTALEEP